MTSLTECSDWWTMNFVVQILVVWTIVFLNCSSVILFGFWLFYDSISVSCSILFQCWEYMTIIFQIFICQRVQNLKKKFYFHFQDYVDLIMWKVGHPDILCIVIRRLACIFTMIQGPFVFILSKRIFCSRLK